ncbi:hypothetical protein D3C87_701590 [compost metagenome]
MRKLIIITLILTASLAHGAEPKTSSRQLSYKASNMMSKTARATGSEGVGGGDSVKGPSGQRQLLDLAEVEDLEYFTPLRTYDNGKIVNGIATFEYQRVRCGFDSMMSKKLLFVVMYAMGVQRYEGALVKDCQGQSLGYYSPSDSFDSNIKIRIKNGILPPITPLRWAYVNIDLEDVDDAGIIRITNPKTLKQLAIQKDGLVVINKAEFQKLDNESKDALFLHEAVLYAVKKLNPSLLERNGTAQVRSYVRNLVRYFSNWEYPRKTAESFPREPVEDAMEALQIK